MATTARATPPTNLDVWLMGQKVREAGAVGDEAVATAVLVELRARPGAAAQYVRCNPASLARALHRLPSPQFDAQGRPTGRSKLIMPMPFKPPRQRKQGTKTPLQKGGLSPAACCALHTARASRCVSVCLVRCLSRPSPRGHDTGGPHLGFPRHAASPCGREVL